LDLQAPPGFESQPRRLSQSENGISSRIPGVRGRGQLISVLRSDPLEAALYWRSLAHNWRTRWLRPLTRDRSGL